MTKVKICGITTIDDAQVAVAAGADMIGLNFYPPSPRYVTPEQAHSIVAHLPSGCAAVGVFVNENLDTVTHRAQTSGVHLVQLHGTESPAMCQQLSWRVIKTFRFTAQVQPEIMRQYRVEALLIEGFHPDVYGGGGVQADGQRVASLHQYDRITLAGGLTPENVREAIRIVRPYAVDVCSGVEATPGTKDWDKAAPSSAMPRTLFPQTGSASLPESTREARILTDSSVRCSMPTWLTRFFRLNSTALGLLHLPSIACTVPLTAV